MKQHKRSISAILALLVCLLFSISSFTAFAQSPMQTISSETIQLEDGYYVKTELQVSLARSSGSPVTRRMAVYDSKNVRLCELALQATFTYNGSTVTCTSSKAWGTSFESGWSVTNIANTHSAGASPLAYANASGLAKKKVLGITTKTHDLSVQITCDRDGNYA